MTRCDTFPKKSPTRRENGKVRVLDLQSQYSFNKDSWNLYCHFYKMKKGAIVGLVIFVSILLIIIGLVAYFFWRYQQEQDGDDIF